MRFKKESVFIIDDLCHVGKNSGLLHKKLLALLSYLQFCKLKAVAVMEVEEEPPQSAVSLAPPPISKGAHRGSFQDLVSRVLASTNSNHTFALPDQVVRSGQLDELKNLVHHGVVEAKTWRESSTKRSLLHLAAASNQVEIINFLLGECRVDVNAQDSNDNTALHLAVICGHLEATGAILTHKPNDALRNKDHNPPLHIAIKQGAEGVNMVSEFIKHPTVDLFVRGHHGYTSLHVIAKTDNLKALKLIQSETPPAVNVASYVFLKNRNGNSTFHLASRVGSHGVLRYILSTFASADVPVKSLITDLSDDSKLPLHYAVERGHIESVRVLLEYGGDPTAVSGHHPPPIHIACSHGKLEIVKLMVEKCGVSVLQTRDEEGGTTLHSSTVSINCRDLVAYLVQHGVDANDVDVNGFSPLSNAIQLGSVYAVEELLKQGGDPRIKDKLGYTALHRAVLSERIEVFRKIASSDAVYVMAKTADSQGKYPIHHALKLGLHEIVVALLAVTAEVFHDQDGNNYLHLASSSGDEHSFMHLLCTYQYMINEVNFLGCTPLHCAAMASNTNIVKKLLDHGAVIHKDNKGHTPFMLACSKGNLAVVKLLYSKSQYQRDWVDNSECTALHLAVDGRNTDIITFCLDTGMSITLNEDQLSFFDKILSLNCRKLAKAVVSHKRWEECIDTCFPDKSKPILSILEHMPDIYQIILDQCYTKCSLDLTHPDYWEKFNFKCLYLEPCPESKDDKQNEEDGQEGDIELVTYDPVHTQLHTESVVAVEDITSVQRFRRQATQRRRTMARGWHRRVRRKPNNTLTVVRKLIKYRLESYLLHPVVEAYIKMKWNGFGLYYQLITMTALFLLAFFFSVFVTQIPIPLQTINSTLANQSDDGVSSFGTGPQVLLIITLLLAILNFVVFLLDVYVNGLRLILEFIDEFLVWSNFLASVNIIIHLVSVLVNGVQRSLWSSAALGVFFAWFSFGFSLQFLNILNIGIYITMLKSSTKLIMKVLIILGVFLLAFSFSFYILVGTVDVLQYSTVPLSLFNQLHTLVGVIDYLGFVTIEQSDDEMFRFSALVFLFLVVQVIILPIVVINLLIGLAVGDIALIRKEAVITRQAVEVRALSSLDRRILPNCLIKQLSKSSHKHYPNRKNWRAWTINFFHKTFDSKNIVQREIMSKRNLEVVLKQDQEEEKKKHERRLDQIQEMLEQLNADRLVHLDRLKSVHDMVTKAVKTQELEAKDVIKEDLHS